jgi:hypothetical protein
MQRGEMLGAAIHERDEIRGDATKFFSITHRRSRKGARSDAGHALTLIFQILSLEIKIKVKDT